KTIENELEDATDDPDYSDTYERGRVAFYLKGKVRGDVLITAALDTGEEDLDQIFSNLDEKNPRELIERIDPDEYYPVYGDDSTAETDAPTAGKFYVKIERNDSHVLWGTFDSEVNETEYLRNERTLYGAQVVWRSPRQTTRGEPRVEAEVYGAQPDTLPQRDVFLGTGGSTYFLRFQDITRGSETVQIEIRDPDTGRVLSRRSLTFGDDYDINYIQGLIILRSPLSGSATDNGLIVDNPNGDEDAFLVVTYDHTPTLNDIESFSYGGRVQVWATDQVRVGATFQDDESGTSSQQAYGFDLFYQMSERTYFEAEFARTDGTGEDQDLSLDGGLSFTTQPGVTGDGRAVRFAGQVDFEDLGLRTTGVIGGYYEDRDAGFSSLDFRNEVDERLWGIYAEVDLNDRTAIRLTYDEIEDSDGRLSQEGEAIIAYSPSETLTWEVGVKHTEDVIPNDPEDTGSRTDAAVRLTYEPSEIYTIYGFVQGTLARSGELERNDRLGFGGEVQIAEKWRLSGEISEGSLGFGARALLTYEPNEDESIYGGYTLDPDRDFGGVTLTGRDRGSFVLGGRRRVNERVTFFGENTYDLFGEHKSLTSAYGVDYRANENLSFDVGLEVGRITDPVNDTDFDRQAISVGASYSDDALNWRGRLEYRLDQGEQSGSDRDAETIAADFALRYKISDSARFLFAFEGVASDNATESIPDAEYLETSIGYAYRPVDNDRLNILAKYSYLIDMTERNQTTAVDSTFLTTPRQRAHVLSFDATYDLNQNWTVGGKIGARISDQDNGNGFVSNNASLAVLDLRYHLTHKWDVLLEYRRLNAEDIGSDSGVLGAVYRHIGNNAKIGLGYNAGRFSDDLNDVTYDDRGVFLNVVGKF
ncbi:MAG: TonB-dependent receptor, partial [Pseudomonadota bacterium]